MKIGLNSGIFPADWTPHEKVEASARVGASGMEVNIDANALWMQRLDQDARRALLQQARAAGVTISSLCMNAHWIFNLASPDVRIRDLGVGLLIEAIDLASHLEAATILVPGCDQDQSPDNKWDLFRSGLLQAVAYAERAGVQLALEAVGKPFLLDTAKLLAMVEDCGNPAALGLYLDIGNSTSSGLDPVEEIRKAEGKALLTHVKDWNPSDRADRRLGAGAVDFKQSIGALRDIGYTDYLIVELPPDPADPDRVARESVSFMRNVLDA